MSQHQTSVEVEVYCGACYALEQKWVKMARQEETGWAQGKRVETNHRFQCPGCGFEVKINMHILHEETKET